MGSGGTNFISGTCGAVSPLATYSQHRYAIDLGGSTDLGYNLVVNTCVTGGLATVLDTGA